MAIVVAVVVVCQIEFVELTLASVSLDSRVSHFCNQVFVFVVVVVAVVIFLSCCCLFIFLLVFYFMKISGSTSFFVTFLVFFLFFTHDIVQANNAK